MTVPGLLAVSSAKSSDTVTLVEGVEMELYGYVQFFEPVMLRGAIPKLSVVVVTHCMPLLL